MCPMFVMMPQLCLAVTHLRVESTAFTFCDSFSSSSLTASMCDRDLRHSLLKMSFISGEHSDRTLRHSEMRSTSSSVIGFLGREDLPRWSTVTMMSMASATKDCEGQTGRTTLGFKIFQKQLLLWHCVAGFIIFTKELLFLEMKDNSHFVSFCLEQSQHNAGPLWSVWWPEKLPHKNPHPSGTLWVEVWKNKTELRWCLETLSNQLIITGI